MEEKILIQGEKYDLKKILIGFLAVAFLVFFVVFCYYALDAADHYDNQAADIKNDIKRLNNLESVKSNSSLYEGGEYTESYYKALERAQTRLEYMPGKISFIFAEVFDRGSYIYDPFNGVPKLIAHECVDVMYTKSYDHSEYFVMIPFFVISLIGVFLFFALKKSELTVTDKRVYGKVMFGKQVDLPMDSISATSTLRLLKGVTVSTSSGKISFSLIKNSNEVYSVLSKLLAERQSAPKAEPTAPVAHAPSTDNADQLQKYKALLDSGVITQEEFDAKKKQLLGL